MKKHFIVASAVAVLVPALLVPAAARAQSPKDVAMAEGLFNQGVKLLEQKKYADACDMLEQSRKLATGLGVTLYLADCQENNNRPVAAFLLFREAEKLAAARKDAREKIAHDRADKLEKAIPRLTFRVSADVAAAGQQIIFDGRRLEQKEWGQPMMVEPGPHKIRSMSEDGNAWESEVTAVAGASTAMDIPLLRPSRNTTTPLPTPTPTPIPTPTPTPTPAPTPPAENASRAAPGATQRTVGLVVAGVGVVGLGLGTVFGLSAKSKQSDAEAHCNAADKCDPTGLGLRQDGLHAATLSTVFFVVGTAAVAGGAVLYLIAPKGDAKAGLAVAPALSARDAGFILRGKF